MDSSLTANRFANRGVFTRAPETESKQDYLNRFSFQTVFLDASAWLSFLSLLT